MKPAMSAPMAALRETYLAAGWTPDPVNSARLERRHIGDATVDEQVTIVSEYRVDYQAKESGWFPLCWAHNISARETLGPVPWYVMHAK